MRKAANVDAIAQLRPAVRFHQFIDDRGQRDAVQGIIGLRLISQGNSP